MTTAWKKQLALGAITALTLVVGRGSTAMGAPAAQTDEDTLTPSQPSSSSGGDSVESKVGCVDFPLVIKDLSVLARDFSSEGNTNVTGNMAVSDKAEMGERFSVSGNLRVGGELDWPSREESGTIGGELALGASATATFNFDAAFASIELISQKMAAGRVLYGRAVNITSMDELTAVLGDPLVASGFVAFNMVGDGWWLGKEEAMEAWTCDGSGKDFVFNFFEADSVELARLTLCGVVLAPFAEVSMKETQVKGAVYARSVVDGGDVDAMVSARAVTACVNLLEPEVVAPVPEEPSTTSEVVSATSVTMTTSEVVATTTTTDVSSTTTTSEVSSTTTTSEVSSTTATSEVSSTTATTEITSTSATSEVSSTMTTPEVSSTTTTPEVVSSTTTNVGSTTKPTRSRTTTATKPDPTVIDEPIYDGSAMKQQLGNDAMTVVSIVAAAAIAMVL